MRQTTKTIRNYEKVPSLRQGTFNIIRLHKFAKMFPLYSRFLILRIYSAYQNIQQSIIVSDSANVQ